MDPSDSAQDAPRAWKVLPAVAGSDPAVISDVIQSLGSLYDSWVLLISLSNSMSGPFKNVTQVVIFGSEIDHLSSRFEHFLKNTMFF